MTNVVRFPMERRAKPSLLLLDSIAPDSREVSRVVEEAGLDDRLGGLRDEADRAMAEYILNHVEPQPGARRRAELDALLRPVIERAVAVCRVAHAAAAARRANERFIRTRNESGYWLAPLEDAAAAKREEAARRLIEAHIASEEARHETFAAFSRSLKSLWSRGLAAATALSIETCALFA